MALLLHHIPRKWAWQRDGGGDRELMRRWMWVRLRLQVRWWVWDRLWVRVQVWVWMMLLVWV